MTEYQNGTLTKDRLNQLVAQHDAIMDKAKKAGKVVLAVGAVAGAVFAAAKVTKTIRENDPEFQKLQNEKLIRENLDKGIKPEELAQIIGDGAILDAQMKTNFNAEQLSAVITACDKGLGEISQTEKKNARKNDEIIDRTEGNRDNLIRKKKDIDAQVNTARKSGNHTLYAKLQMQSDSLDKEIKRTSNPNIYMKGTSYNGGANLSNDDLKRRNNLEKTRKAAAKELFGSKK